jgi:hypothetical protein
MTKKVFSDNVQEEQMETPVAVEPRVKQMVRWISGGINETGDSVFTIDDELSGYLAKGYRLFATHYVGTDPTNGVGVLYVLVLL